MSKRNRIFIGTIFITWVIITLLIYVSDKKSERFPSPETRDQSQLITSVQDDKTIPVNIPKKENISEKDQQIYDYLQSRWDFYEQRDRAYIPEEHDDLVLSEAAKKFGFTKDEIFKIFDKVEKIRLGIKPKEKIFLDVENIPVDIIIKKIKLLSDNVLQVTVENRTEKSIILPTINLTFDLYQETINVGHRIVWVKNLGYSETKTYTSSSVGYDFDTVQATGYMNIDEMKAVGLKSNIQASNDPGETVIPILRFKKLTIKEQVRKEKPKIEFLTPTEKSEEKPFRERERGIRGPLGESRKIELQVEPPYPEWARKRGMTGVVEVKCWVLPSGEVRNVEVCQSSGLPRLDEHAAQYLMLWKFESIKEKKIQWGIVPFHFEFPNGELE